jgi:hypothetical protein
LSVISALQFSVDPRNLPFDIWQFLLAVILRLGAVSQWAGFGKKCAAILWNGFKLRWTQERQPV